MKKSFISLALAVALVLAFAATASATSAKTWNYQEDYYSWGSSMGAGLAATGTLGTGGSTTPLTLLNTNPTNPGVHANYQTTTAKCGICHSVHRAKAGGAKLLNASVATCAGCHAAGTGTVTSKLVSWQTGGPHSSGNLSSCSARSCHADNPHGANGSVYKIFSAKLLSPNGDVVLASALTSAASGITLNELNAGVGAVWTEGTRSAVRTGYTCNQADCHTQTMLPVIKKNWAEERGTIYPAMTPTKLKTGHLSLGAANAAAGSYTALNGCVSCHDQTDAGTTSGFTFPHSETAFGASNTTGRAWLWMTRASNAGLGDQVGMGTTNEKSMDGACLKCHRASNGTSGIGLDQ